MRLAKQFWRYLVGFPIALLGFALVMSEAFGRLHTHTAPSVLLLSIGILFVFAGGFIINDTLTKAIADAVLARLPAFLPLAGGRRSYDPPAPPPASGATDGDGGAA